MTIESAFLSSDEALARIDRDRPIDGFIGALSRGEQPKTEDLDVTYLKEVLTDAGANFELNPGDREMAIQKLSNLKYTEARPNRRPGVVAVWGESNVAAYEAWAQTVSEKTCPMFKDDNGETINGSQARGLRQLLADITELALGGKITIEGFVKQTSMRSLRGIARSESKEVPKSVIAMIPAGSLQTLWGAIRGGKLPG